MTGELEGLAKAIVPVVLGVIIAGFILNQLGSSFTLLTDAQKGYTG